MTRLLLLWDSIRSSYWLVPALLTLIAAILAVVFVNLDERLPYEVLGGFDWVYGGEAEGARAVLSVIGGSIITVAGTTFTITIAVLSLASGQYGPRVLNSFMRDRGSQIVMGVFTATFLYCLLVLRTIRNVEENLFVPHLAVTFGFVLASVSVAVLIYFIHHIARSIQPARIIEVMGSEVDRSIARIFPEHAGERADGDLPDEVSRHVVRTEEHGYVAGIDVMQLLKHAAESNSIVELKVRPGTSLVPGQEVAYIWGGSGEKLAKDVQDSITSSSERTTYQDVEFAFLQISEMAIRALSSGINDPFTAVLCVDRMASSLARLGQRHLPDSRRADKNGKLRLIAPIYQYDELIDSAFGTVIDNASGSRIVLEQMVAQIARLQSLAENSELQRALAAVGRRAKHSLKRFFEVNQSTS